MSLRQKKYTAFAVMLGIPVLLFLILTALEPAGLAVYDIPSTALSSAVFGFLLYLLWIRCPHCGRHLDRNNGDYCQYCGEEIDWDGKPGQKGDQL